MTRLCTLSEGGRIDEGLVQAEIARLQWQWGAADLEHAQRTGAQKRYETGAVESLLPDQTLDAFDACQLDVVIQVCRDSNSLADAGRRLFAQSRQTRKVVNDADRLRKYLMKFGLSWEQLQSA